MIVRQISSSYSLFLPIPLTFPSPHFLHLPLHIPFPLPLSPFIHPLSFIPSLHLSLSPPIPLSAYPFLLRSSPIYL